MKLYIKVLTLLLTLFVVPHAIAQTIKGKVLEKNTKDAPVSFASVFWLSTTIGTLTDSTGEFSIQQPDSFPSKLVIGLVGYKTDTVVVSSPQFVSVRLVPDRTLKEVTVVGKNQSNSVSAINPLHVEKISTQELQKAACCNLSESFQTNASVDVGYTDAISGAKQIQMLGLDGVYSQIMSENIPFIRGLSSAYGLSYVPGTWIESIYVTKGTGSVVNGFESISGQIQLELIEPADADRLFVNAYANNNLRTEANIHLGHKINDSLSTVLLLHGSNDLQKVDNNGDNFLDNPLTKQINVLNRWHFNVPGKREHQWGVHFIGEDRAGGDKRFNYDRDYGKSRIYGVGIKTRMADAFTKNGFLFKDKPYKSIGTMLSLRYHEHDSYFGLKKFEADQKSLYMNGIYQTIIGDTRHTIKSGTSLQYDDFNQAFNDSSFDMEEIVPGVFTEYTYNDLNKISLVAGIRADHHNLYGLFFTPRLHFKYNYAENSALRFSAGKGYRTSRVFSENSSVFASSRNVIVMETFDQEEAWNYGVTLTHKFTFMNRDASFDVDYFRTDFVNQVIVDVEDSRTVKFYNLKGKSYANSFQSGINFFAFEGFEVKVAYKIYDVKSEYLSGLKFKPLISRQRALANLSYSTPNEIWKFDYTFRWFGKSRLPSTENNSHENHRSTTSPSYLLMYAQVTKAFKRFDVYLGAENINNFMQHDPILEAENPFGKEFDASMIWGPVMGRTIYAGLRFSIK